MDADIELQEMGGQEQDEGEEANNYMRRPQEVERPRETRSCRKEKHIEGAIVLLIILLVVAVISSLLLSGKTIELYVYAIVMGLCGCVAIFTLGYVIYITRSNKSRVVPTGPVIHAGGEERDRFHAGGEERDRNAARRTVVVSRMEAARRLGAAEAN